MVCNKYSISLVMPVEGKQLFNQLCAAARQVFREETCRFSLIQTVECDDAGEFQNGYLQMMFDERLFASHPIHERFRIQVGGPPLHAGRKYDSVDFFVYQMRASGWGLWKPFALTLGAFYPSPISMKLTDIAVLVRDATFKKE